MAAELGLPRQIGAHITEVRPNTPAEAAKLQPGDVILEFNNTPIEDDNQFVNLVSLTEVGKRVSLVIFRELPGWRFLPALALMLAGTYLSVTDSIRLQHTHAHSHVHTHAHVHGGVTHTHPHEHTHTHLHVHGAETGEQHTHAHAALEGHDHVHADLEKTDNLPGNS